jgi:hypothetical protein
MSTTLFLVVDMFPMEKCKPLYHWLVKVIISSSRHKYKPLYHWLVKLIISFTSQWYRGLYLCLLLEIITFTNQWYRGLYFSIENMSTTGNNYFHQSKYKPLYHWLVKVFISSSRHVSNGKMQTSVSLTGESNHFQ